MSADMFIYRPFIHWLRWKLDWCNCPGCALDRGMKYFAKLHRKAKR